MDQEKKSSENWKNAVVEWVTSHRALIKLKMIDGASSGAAVGIVGLLSLVVGIFMLLFAGLGIAMWLGESLDNMKAGFFLVGFFYVLIFIALLAMCKKILIPRIRDLIIKKIYEQD